MEGESGHLATDAARAASNVWSRSTNWAAYAACGWALVFAAMSFYWALGGSAGLDTQAESIKELALARDPGFIALVWITGGLKVFGGLVALALVQRWGRLIPRWMLLIAAGGGGVLGVLQGGGGLVQHGLMEAGVIPISESIGSTTALRWHLLLWDPWWLLGGILFCAAAWGYQRGSRDRHAASEGE